MKLILLICFCGYVTALFAQTSITYTGQATFGHDTRNSAPKGMARIFDKVVQEMASAENSYTFNDTLILFERNQFKLSPDEMIFLKPGSLQMWHYYTGSNNGEKRLSVTPIGGLPEVFQYRYTVDSFLLERKQIAGYDCFKIVVEETRENRKSGMKRESRYELFVTDRLSLPANVIVPLPGCSLSLCPLEYKTIRLDQPDSWETWTAVRVASADARALELPAGFRELKPGH